MMQFSPQAPNATGLRAMQDPTTSGVYDFEKKYSQYSTPAADPGQAATSKHLAQQALVTSPGSHQQQIPGGGV